MYGHQGEKAGSGMNWEIGINIYALLCIKQMTDESFLYNTGTLLNALR